MTLFALNLLLAIVWAAVTGTFSLIGLLVGYAVGYVVLLIARPLFKETGYFWRVWAALAFIAYFFKELFVSSLRVAHDVLTRRAYARPGVITVPMEARTDAEITLLANLVSLTPGTLSLDVSTDRSTLYVHAMFVDDADQVRAEIKDGMEARLLRLLR